MPTIAKLIAKLILLRPRPRMIDGLGGLVSARTLTTPLARVPEMDTGKDMRKIEDPTNRAGTSHPFVTALLRRGRAASRGRAETVTRLRYEMAIVVGCDSSK
jgi:hypothetical protein